MESEGVSVRVGVIGDSVAVQVDEIIWVSLAATVEARSDPGTDDIMKLDASFNNSSSPCGLGTKTIVLARPGINH